MGCLTRKGDTAVVDIRLIHRTLGLTKRELANRAGAIPGLSNVSFGAFYMENGSLKSPTELLCLRYLGFQDVRVHGEAWVNWSRTR